MTSADCESLWTRLAEFLAVHLGLHFGPERREDLRRAMLCAAREFGLDDPESCAQWLLSAPLTKTQIDILAGHLTVGETYFFRHARSFEVLETEILPELLAARRRGPRSLRLWSAGCCTGEEAYSLAILLTRLIPDWRQWQVSILATDVNLRFLQQAAAGVFRDWSFRDTPPGFKENYFRPTGGGGYEILPYLKQLVSFSSLNLAADTYPSLLNNTNAMDVILCRNVLMYFSAPQATRVVSQLQRCLAPDGWLLCSPTDHPAMSPAGLQAVSFPGATVYRRAATAPAAAPLSVSPLPISISPLRYSGEGQGVRAASIKSQSCAWTDSNPSLPVVSHKPAEAIAHASPQPSVELTQDAYAEALALYRQGRYAEAGDRLQGVLARRPDDSKVLALLARVYADQGRLAEAAAWSERSMAADKLSAGAYYLHAAILQEQGAGDEAVRCLNRALYLDPNFVLAHFSLASQARAQGQATAAGKHFQQALKALEYYSPEDLLPESDGVTARRLREMITAMMPS